VTGKVAVYMDTTPYLQDLSGLADLSVHTCYLVSADSLTTFGSLHLTGAAASPGGAWLYINGLPAATGSMTITGSDVDVVYIYNAPQVESVTIAVRNFSDGASVAVQSVKDAAVNMSGSHFIGPSLNVLLFDRMATLSFAGATGNVSSIIAGISLIDISSATTFAGLEALFSPGGAGVSSEWTSPGGLTETDANVVAGELATVEVSSCSSLVDLNGIGGLAGVLAGSLEVFDNPSLTNVSALRYGITGLIGQTTSTYMYYGNLYFNSNPLVESLSMEVSGGVAVH
jgi:hypothetical protein